MKERMKWKQKPSQYFSTKATLAGSQSFFGQLPGVGREFDKGKLGFRMFSCFCFLSPRVYFSNEFFYFFFIVMGIIMKILLVISSVKVPWQNGLQILAMHHISIFWFETPQPKSSGNIFRKDHCSGPQLATWTIGLTCCLAVISLGMSRSYFPVTLLSVQPPPKCADICKKGFLYCVREWAIWTPRPLISLQCCKSKSHSVLRKLNCKEGKRYDGRQTGSMVSKHEMVTSLRRWITNSFISFQLYKSRNPLSREF